MTVLRPESVCRSIWVIIDDNGRERPFMADHVGRPGIGACLHFRHKFILEPQICTNPWYCKRSEIDVDLLVHLNCYLDSDAVLLLDE